jgi:hypothetical protein
VKFPILKKLVKITATYVTHACVCQFSKLYAKKQEEKEKDEFYVLHAIPTYISRRRRGKLKNYFNLNKIIFIIFYESRIYIYLFYLKKDSMYCI